MNNIPLLDHDSKTPLHQQAEEQLRKLIRDNHFRVGDTFPKETDLAKRWGISRNTLRQAIANLVKDGLLERKKRTGTTVRKKKITTDLANWLSFSQEMEDKGTPFKDLKHSVEKVKAIKETAERLGVPAGTAVIALERIRSTGKNPMVYFQSFFHPRIGLTVEANFKRPLYELLDEEYHTVPVYSQEEIRAIAATEKIAAWLKVAAGAPVLERKRLVLDAAKKPIEFNICYYRSDWFTYSIEIKRPI
ncbi:GntR family transcriptional regulator [Chitinophaga sp. Cy-1792]|uniref:GntR family transcriptional regulator n=1 Tax=Chitinophaga sp. Cy-1792 TaxID=2608339 RepID=UPI00141F0409|nr:GntR family transcriptional regulator [Chitinophaga sp. Cy-1792]NIG56835.1 GntR family transcriptional regulator [Chitinophaga sp. Cy-1792]